MSASVEALCSFELPGGDEVVISRRRFVGGPGPRVVIVAAVRGDTPEGTRVAHVVARYLAEVHERLLGTVDIYPCVNPLAADHGARNWPAFDVDLNRRFPGRADGHGPDLVARALLDAVAGSAQVIELRGAHPAFREETQAHVWGSDPVVLDRATRTNVRVVWRRSDIGARTGTLASVVPGLICLEGGVGNRLTDGVGQELADGVLNLLVVLGVLPEADLPFHWAAIQRPLVASDEQVIRVHAERGGLFLPLTHTWAELDAGDAIGEVVDPVRGDTLDVILSPVAGRVLAQREQPVVYPGSLVARMVRA